MQVTVDGVRLLLVQIILDAVEKIGRQLEFYFVVEVKEGLVDLVMTEAFDRLRYHFGQDGISEVGGKVKGEGLSIQGTKVLLNVSFAWHGNAVVRHGCVRYGWRKGEYKEKAACNALIYITIRRTVVFQR